MIMRPDELLSLWSVSKAASTSEHFIASADVKVALSGLQSGTAIRCQREQLRGRSVLLAADDQIATALALLELDGIARRLVLCPADISKEHLPAIADRAEIDVIVSDREPGFFQDLSLPVVKVGGDIEKAKPNRIATHVTEWVLFTSGTTGIPKMAVHTLSGLTGAIRPGGSPSQIWATFYDIRRYGGLQIFLRAISGNCSLVLSSPHETLSDHLATLAKHNVTHISGTPSHWRRVLMSGSAQKIAPNYVRLSGEIADQGILDGLRAHYPQAQIVHAYASTEAGVGFEVKDGREGFPASLVGPASGHVELKVQDGSLRVRSNRAALGYLGEKKTQIEKEDGFVDTGDLVELRGDRYYFTGRKDGAINVGGQKVSPEEVEAVINRHPRVHLSLVHARKSPIIGSLVVAEIVPKELSVDGGANGECKDLEDEIRAVCFQNLARHKVPAQIRFVSSLPMTVGGKLARNNA